MRSKMLSEFLSQEGEVKEYLTKLMEKYTINEKTEILAPKDLINILKNGVIGDPNSIDIFTNKEIIKAGLIGLRIEEDRTATLLLT